MKRFLAVAFARDVMGTAAKVALLVGTILALINYGDRIFLHYDMHPLDRVKIAVTYLVPYCVATYGAVIYAMRHDRNKSRQ
jgi:hypothetical protein